MDGTVMWSASANRELVPDARKKQGLVMMAVMWIDMDHIVCLVSVLSK